jgi:hypothetical protein
MFLVLPSSKLAEHDLIDGIVCPNSFTYPLQKAFGVYTNGGKAGAHWVQHGLHQRLNIAVYLCTLRTLMITFYNQT